MDWSKGRATSKSVSVEVLKFFVPPARTYFATLSLLNTINSSIYNKEYKKFQDYIAIIGGLVKIVTLLGSSLNYFNSMNTYYLKIINDFIIENKIADKNKKQCIQNSSMAIFPKSKNNINNDISRIDSGLNPHY